MLLRLWIRAADLWLEWNVKQLKIKVHLFFFIKKNNILPTKPPRTCTRIPVMLRSSYYLHFHFLRRHAGHAWDNLELRWWCCCCCSQFSQHRSGECRRRLPRPRRLLMEALFFLLHSRSRHPNTVSHTVLSLCLSPRWTMTLATLLTSPRRARFPPPWQTSGR